MSAEDKKKLDTLQAFDMSRLEVATNNNAGLMSAEDKKKLDELKTNSVAYNQQVSSVNNGPGLFIDDINYWPRANQTVQLKKPISTCANGIILVWRLEETDDLYHYQYIPKFHVRAHGSLKVTEVIPTDSIGGLCTKTLCVTDSNIWGVDDNYKNNSNKIRLHQIIEY